MQSMDYIVNKYSFPRAITFFHSVLLISFSCVHADRQPYLLFADGENGAIYHSNLDGSGIQALVIGLPRPIALDFDYRYNTNNQLNDLVSFVYC